MQLIHGLHFKNLHGDIHGGLVASLLFVKRMADLELASFRVITVPHEDALLSPEETEILAQNQGSIVLIHVDGPMSFGSANNMVRRLDRVKEFSTFRSVVLDLSDVPLIDVTAAMAVEDMLRVTHAYRQHLFFVGMQPQVTEVLESMGMFRPIRPGYQYATRLEALHAAAQVNEQPEQKAVPVGSVA